MRTAENITLTISGLLISVFVIMALGGSPVLCHAAENPVLLKTKARDLYYGLNGEQNYAKALQLYLRAAKRGDAEAKFIAGGMYFKGLGTVQNYDKAFKLLLEAAQKGISSPESQLIIAQEYFLGNKVPKNYEKALEWYKEAAGNGNVDAQNELGYLYYLGKGVPQDSREGARFFKLAAYNNYPLAQYNLGMAYYSGNGMDKQDLKSAYAWMTIAAANGYQAAAAASNFLENILARDELREAQQLAIDLKDKIKTP